MHMVWANLYPGTPAEKALEPAVASLGVRYRTQFPLFLWHGNTLPYFPDFALLDYKVAIEVDDPGHDKPDKIEEDKARTSRLSEMGWVVVRCTNEDALTNPYATVNRMMAQLRIPLVADPEPAPPRFDGNGETLPENSFDLTRRGRVRKRSGGRPNRGSGHPVSPPKPGGRPWPKR